LIGAVFVLHAQRARSAHSNNRAVCGVIDFRSTVSRSSGLIDDEGAKFGVGR
jgi:hypothetical protein